MLVNTSPGANFTNRLKLSQLSLCVRFKPKNRLKSVREIGPRALTVKSVNRNISIMHTEHTGSDTCHDCPKSHQFSNMLKNQLQATSEENDFLGKSPVVPVAHH